MKLSVKIIALTVATAALCMPAADARGRNDASHNGQRTENRHQSPAKQSHNNNGNRHQRPDEKRNHNSGNHNQRPDGSFSPSHSNHGHNPGSRPAGGNNGFRPGNDKPRPPQQGHQPGPAFGNHNHHHPQTPPPPPMQKPHRPYMPAHRPWQRPTPPPPAYRPAAVWTPFRTILGVTLGSAINLSINTLLNNGYNVTGYGNDVVYIADAQMLNMFWPDATLYYNNGGLYASEFVYSTPYYNMSRYNSAYNALVRNYGPPVSSTNNGGSITTTWWGPTGQFINLTFQNAIAGNGSMRFFTTLSFGN